jgi:hypothetical protein
VITAVVLELTGDGVTVKLAVVEPELTVTEAGTAADALPLESATLVLLAGATFRVTVQVEAVGAVMLDGLQVRLVGTGTGGWLMVTVAPLAVIVRGLPLLSDPDEPTSVTGEDVAVVPAAIWNVTVATTPFPIGVVLMPATTHRISPGEMVLHVADFPAALAAAPVA